MVNLEWYRSFIEVYRVGTVSGAAQFLHLTQPAVSQHLAALESALGHTLFQRTPRRMIPTDEGKRLYTQVAEAIEKLESISAASRSFETPQILRLGTPYEFFTERVLHQLPSHENALYRVQFGLAQELIEQLLSEQLDLVIATQKLNRNDLEYQLVFEEEFWLVASPTAVISTSETIDLTSLEQWLRQQPLIAYSEELPIIRRFWRVVFKRRIDVVPKFVIPNLIAIRQAIEKGLGYSVLPHYLCEPAIAANRLALIFQPTDTVSNQLWLAFRKSERNTLKIKFLLDRLCIA